jgi:hypothetical protein
LLYYNSLGSRDAVTIKEAILNNKDKPTDKVYTFRPIAGVEVTEVLQSGGGDGLDVTVENDLKTPVKAFLSWVDGATGQALTSPTIDVQPGKTEGPYTVHFSASSKDFTLTAAPL